MTFKLRPATPDDAAAIAQVHVTSWQHTYQGLFSADFLAHLSVPERQQQWQQWLATADSTHLAWVAEREGQIGAFVSGGPERTQHPVLQGEIYALYLLPSWQRQGLGAALWRTARQELKRQGLSGLCVWVWRDNPATAFYIAQGGVYDRERTVVLQGVSVPEVSYAWADDPI